MKVIFVRHGETDVNLLEKQGKAISENNAPLNAHGLEQAREVAQKLKNEKIGMIFCSPYKRAIMTCQEINKFHHVAMDVLDGLRERDCGNLVGKEYHDLFDFDKNVKGEDIEPVRDFFERVYRAIRHIELFGYDNVVVVSHGGVSHAFRAYFNNLEWKGNLRVDRLGNCDIRVYETGKKENVKLNGVKK